MTQSKEEFDKAVDIQTQTYSEINDLIKKIIQTQEAAFPDHILLVPTLCLAALCQYINSYIETFPDTMKPKIISMAYNAIGFTPSNEQNDLATMEVAGHA